MNLPLLRNAIAEFLKTKLPAECKITTDYSPVLELGETDTGIVVQPNSLAMSLADRSTLACEGQLIITVAKKLGVNRNAVGDEILVLVHDIAHSLHGLRFGEAVVKDMSLSDPILSEDNIGNGNMAIAQITVTLYGQERRA